MTTIHRWVWSAASSYEWAALCRATEALLEPLDTPIFSPGCHCFVSMRRRITEATWI